MNRSVLGFTAFSNRFDLYVSLGTWHEVTYSVYEMRDALIPD